MKRKFLDSSIKLIRNNRQYSDDEIEVIAYGLEGLYLTFSKMIILFCLAYILGIIKEFILLLVFYNIIRSQAFGIHASKSIYCLVSSILLFIVGALVCKYITFSFWFSLSSALISDVCLFFYAPADTYKRPIINKEKRKRFKCLSLLFGIIYTVIIVIFRNHYIVNYLVVGLLESVIAILPITYKLFKLPYNNYKTYYDGV